MSLLLDMKNIESATVTSEYEDEYPDMTAAIKEEDEEDKDPNSKLPRMNSQDYRYNWRYYVPSGTNCCRWFRWFVVGGTAFAQPQSTEELEDSLQGLAKCLLLIRRYLALYGMPKNGQLLKDQQYVLREICRDLYSGGAPLWALEPVMQKAAEGLTVSLLRHKAQTHRPAS